MTDEGLTGTPMDGVEFINAMRNVASGVRAFYVGLVEEGFTDAEALRLTLAYVTGIASSSKS